MTASFAENSGSGWEWIDNAQGTPETSTEVTDRTVPATLQWVQWPAMVAEAPAP